MNDIRITNITPGFCNVNVLRAGLTSINAAQVLPHKHLFGYNHYPLASESELHDVCDEFGLEWIDLGGDYGGVSSANALISHVTTEFVFGHDPDCLYPLESKGYDEAIVKILDEDKTLAWVSLTPIPLRNGYIANPDGHIEIIAGYRVYFHHTVDMWSAGGSRTEYLQANPIEGHFKYYGQVEIPMYERLQATGMRYGYLLDYPEDSFGYLHDIDYMKWKNAHLKGYEGSFGSWLLTK